MKYLFTILVAISIVTFLAGCSKGDGGGGGTPTPAETALTATVDPNPGSSTGISLSATYAFKLVITSTVPKNGVKVDVTATKESDNSAHYSQSSQTASSSVTSVDLSVPNLAQGVVYNVKVDVTSLTSSTNKTSVSFKVTRK